MFTRLMIACALTLLAVPAYGGTGFSGVIANGHRVHASDRVERAAYYTDITGSSDDIGSFDARLVTIIHVSPYRKTLHMKAMVSPQLQKHYKTILQMFVISGVSGQGNIANNVIEVTDDRGSSVLVSVQKNIGFKVYRKSNDGGMTWSPLERAYYPL